MLKKLNKPLLLIILLGLFLRLYGINHGLPFIYSVDEPALERSSYNIRFNLNPGHFDWPHLHFYLNFLLYLVIYVFRGTLQVFGLKSFISKLLPVLWEDPIIFFLASRVFDAFIGAFTAIPIYLTGKKLFSKKMGLLSAMAISVFPYHVWSSHFALVDVPMTFWFTWSVYFSALLMLEGKKRWYILAGLFAGLSASTKYNGGYAIFVIILAHILYLKNSGKLTFAGFKDKTFKFLLLSAFVSIVVFFAGTPFALLRFKTFIRNDLPVGAFWQFKNVGKVSLLGYMSQLEKVLTTRFISDFSFSFLILFEVYAIYYLIRRKSKEMSFIFLPGLFYFLYITTFDNNRIHYYMLVFPFICFMVAHLQITLGRKFTKSSGVVFLTIAFFTLVYLTPLYFSLKGSFLLNSPDTRNTAYNWLKSNIPVTGKIIYIGSDLDAIMKDSSIKGTKIKSLLSISKGKYGDYLVIGIPDKLESREGYSAISTYLTRVYNLSSKGRMGPDVYIYAFKENP